MISLIIMVAGGLLTHFLKDIVRIKKESGFITPKQYWAKHPYQTTLAIIGATVGFIALSSTGQLTPITAFGVGYMANSVADTIGKRSIDKI